MTAMPLSRSQLLFGSDAMKRLADSRAIVFGVGGVGSWCAEALVRSGIGHLTIVDADCVDVTNINRQLPATSATVGEPKAEVLARRLREIRPDAEIVAIRKFYGPDNAAEFCLDTYSLVVDAIDTVPSKAHLLLQASGVPGLTLVSSMGAARRTNPAMIKSAEFWNVRGCPLARALRDKFKKEQTFPRRKFKCVYSDEQPKGEPKGTFMPVTAAFGLHLAAIGIDSLLKHNIS